MDNLTRIKSVSKRLRIFFTVLAVVIPIMNIVFWLFYNHLPAFGLVSLRETEAELDSITRLMLFAVSLLPIVVLSYGFYIMARLFRLYENAVVFSKLNVHYYRRLGYVIFYWLLALFFYTPLSTLAVSSSHKAGERYVQLGFDSGDVLTLLLAAVIILISWVMDEGRKLADEHTFTV